MSTEAGGVISPTGWVFIAEDEVPEEWRDRAVTVLFVPLLPGEAAELFSARPTRPEMSPDDETLAHFVARGLSIPEIAHEVSISPRSVERRIARMRSHYGARSKADLARLLSASGFGM